MSEELWIALIAAIGPIGVVIGSFVTIQYRQRREWREGGEKAHEKAIEILKGRFDRANDPKELAAIEQQLRQAEDDYLPYLKNKAASISRRVRGELAPAGAIEPDMPELSAPDREALGKAAATIAEFDPPKTAEDRLLQGNAFYAAGEYDRALEEYNHALELPPHDPDTLYNRGYVLDDLQRYDEALVDYNRSLELSPDDAGTLSNRAKALFYLRGSEEALPDFNRSLELRPDDSDTLSDRGVTLANLQRYDEALADYNRALQLRPDHQQASYNRACALSQVGRLPQALRQLEQAIALNSDNRASAREEDDFDNLRSDAKLGPEFERLVAEPES